MLAWQQRREGDDDDAYEHFVGLHDADLLLPTDADRVVALVEIVVYEALPAACAAAVEALDRAISAPAFPATSDETAVVPIAVAVEVVPVDDEGNLADVVVAVYHNRAASTVGDEFLHATVLEALASHLSIDASEWQSTYFSDRFPPNSRAQYVAVASL